jgi:LacI family transcriptional regulator
VNLTEFAEKIGLSISTVSRALNGYDDVSDLTRARVKEAAGRLGYTPNAAGRNLRLGRAEAIGFVLSPPQSSFANFFHSELLSGIDDRVRETSYHLVVTAAKSLADELVILRRMVEQRQVDAVILCRMRRHDERIRYLLGAGVPFATVGRSDTKGEYPWLDIDHRSVARRATERLAGFGHRRIALINTPAIYTYSGDAKRGWAEALAAAGLRRGGGLYAEAEPTEEAGGDAARRLLGGRSPPSGIVAAHDLMALGVLGAIAERRLRAGREISLIGSDDSPLARFTDPPLTTFTASFRRAGQRVAEMLLQNMAGAGASGLHEVWEPELIVRGSDGPVTERSASGG